MLLFFLSCAEVPQKELVHDSQVILKTLSSRDSKINCEDLPKTNLQKELTTIVNSTVRPPWTPMKAASCLMELYPVKAENDLLLWTTDPSKKGLAFLIAGQMKSLPDKQALKIAKAGLQGPHKNDFRIRLEKLNDPRLVSLLGSK